MDHGNLLVAASQAVFVLMAVSAAGLGSLPRAETALEWVKRAGAWVVFALHLIGGLQHVGAKMNLRDWVHPLTYIAIAVLVAWMVAGSVPRYLQPTPRPSV